MNHVGNISVPNCIKCQPRSRLRLDPGQMTPVCVPFRSAHPRVADCSVAVLPDQIGHFPLTWPLVFRALVHVDGKYTLHVNYFRLMEVRWTFDWVSIGHMWKTYTTSAC